MGGDFYGNGNGKANLARNPHGHDVWGKMNHFRGVVVHHISPFEQRTFKGYFSVGAPKMLQRIRAQVFRMGIPFLTGLLIFTWAKDYNHKLNRKDVKHYEDEYNTYLQSDEYKQYLDNKEQEEKEAQRNLKKGK